MAQLPGILAESGTCTTRHYKLQLPADLDCFAGHFPDLPLLPGVVQIEWSLKFAQRHFNLPKRFSHVSALKFMRVIEPGAAITLDLSYDAERRELTFGFFDAGGTASSSGRIGFSAGPDHV